MTVWILILGMAVVTYATRVSAMLVMRGDLASWLQRWLNHVPVAVFMALLLPPLLMRAHGEGATLSIGPALPAGIVGALVAWRSANVLLTVCLGMLTFWVLRWLGL